MGRAPASSLQRADTFKAQNAIDGAGSHPDDWPSSEDEESDSEAVYRQVQRRALPRRKTVKVLQASSVNIKPS